MKNLNNIITPIAAELAQFEVFFEQTMKAETEPMDGIMHYVQESRGKRLRPILVLLGAKMFGTVNERTLRAATFVELIHSATLLHDDVVDDDDERRGRSSVKAQFGNLSAVLAGDFLLAKAMLLLSAPGDHAILQEMLRKKKIEAAKNISITTPDANNENICNVTVYEYPKNDSTFQNLENIIDEHQDTITNTENGFIVSFSNNDAKWFYVLASEPTTSIHRKVRPAIIPEKSKKFDLLGRPAKSEHIIKVGR